MSLTAILYIIIGFSSAILLMLFPVLVLSKRPRTYLTGRHIGFFLILCVASLTAVIGSLVPSMIANGGGESMLSSHWRSISNYFIGIYIFGLILSAVFWFMIARHLLIFHHSATSNKVEQALRDEGWSISRHKILSWTILTCSKNEVRETVKIAREWGCLYLVVSNLQLRSVIANRIIN